MPSSTSKLLTRKNISVKKLYTKGKKFRRVARGFLNEGFLNELRSSIIHAEQSEERERERENEIRDTECPVCQEEMTEDKATKLNCGHKFCNKCLITALQTDNLKCPLCRKPIGGEISRTLLTKSPQDMLIVAKEVLMEAEAMMEVRVQALRATTVSMKEALTVFMAAKEAADKKAAWAAVLAAAAEATAASEALRGVEEAVAEARTAEEEAAEMLERSRAAATRQLEWGRIAMRTARVGRIAARAVRTRAERVGRIATRTARVRRIAARAVGTRAARVRAFWARAVGTRAVGTREAAAREEGAVQTSRLLRGGEREGKAIEALYI